jgi:hypothetical protein
MPGVDKGERTMSIFKKIFRKSENVPDNKKLDINQLINSEDINGSIIELDNYISDLCDYGESLEKLNEHQKIFFYNQTIEREINNGGFNQFYYNSSGDFACETVESLKSIGAEKTALIIQKANGQFPNNVVPQNREERQEILKQIEDKANDIWEKLDEDFYQYEENLNALNMAYIKKHTEHFTLNLKTKH